MRSQRDDDDGGDRAGPGGSARGADDDVDVSRTVERVNINTTIITMVITIMVINIITTITTAPIIIIIINCI